MRIRYVLFAIFIILIILARLLGVGDYVNIETIKENQAQLNSFVSDNYIISVILFITAYIVSVGLSLPIATLLTFSSGFLFGVIFGTVYTNIGATIGATIIFLFTRYVFGEKIQFRYKKQLKRFNKEFQENGVGYLLTLRLIPIFPFFIVNIVAGLTNVRIKNFIWTTSLGILPGSFVFALAGSQIANISSLKGILSPGVIISFILLAALPLLQIAYKKYRGVKDV